MTLPPPLARWLGLAGLIPQLYATAVVLGGDPANRFTALSLGYAYAALILSFLGGIWWGIAAGAAGLRSIVVPRWLWFVAVVPTLIALASALPWALGTPWPQPSLIALGTALIAACGIDWLLWRHGLVPDWWLTLRLPLSIGLGVLTIILGVTGGIGGAGAISGGG